MPARQRVFEVVTDVRDAVGPRHDLAFGGGRRRPAPRVVAHAVDRLRAEVQRGQSHVHAVHRVVVAARDVRGERLLARVTTGTVPAVVREGDRFGEREAEISGAGDARRDLRDLDGMREARAEMIVLGRDEHLTLAGESPPRP